VCFVRSSDGGRTWSAPQRIADDYGETSLLALPDGTLLAAVRHTRRGIVAITRSEDEGRTWSAPQPVTTPVQMPGDLLALADGRVLLTYGRRIAPFGVRAILSRDGGRTWHTQRRVTLVADSITRDCGYPSSVQLADGSIVTAYYAAESSGFWKGSFGWHAGADTLGPHAAVVKYRPEDLP
jgi:Neuraminidase (sialidase)